MKSSKHVLPLLIGLIGICVVWWTITLVEAARAAEDDDHDDRGHVESVDGREDHDGHDDHADHDGHDDHDEGVVKISAEVMAEFGVVVEEARGGVIGRSVRLPGEVVFNGDQIAHVTPSVSGIAGRVRVSAGDRVERGEVMAVLNSRELAAARSDYLAARARLELAEENLHRDQRLFDSKVGTERAVLEARQAAREAQIVLNQNEAALHALGYTHEQIASVESMDDTVLNVFELTAPLGGVVIQRHLTIGEVAGPTGDESPFVIADLSTVWVNLTVYQRDLASARAGLDVDIRFGHGIPDAAGRIAFISPALDEKTRTATARIVLKSPGGHWRPGLFVTGFIETGQAEAAVVVPRSALIEHEGEQVVFVQTAEGFEPRHVDVGRTTEMRAENYRGVGAGRALRGDERVELQGRVGSRIAGTRGARALIRLQGIWAHD